MAAYTIKFGKYKVGVDFTGEDRFDVSLGELTLRTTGGAGPQAIADAARDVVSLHVATEQVTVNQQRVIEDARRILGS